LLLKTGDRQIKDVHGNYTNNSKARRGDDGIINEDENPLRLLQDRRIHEKEKL